MGSWSQVQNTINATGSAHDIVRRAALRDLEKHTGRNVIIYYSGWLEKEMLIKQGLGGFEVHDGDKNGFMATIHELDRSQGLDLVLHTPGGNVAATESIVDYLHAMFGTDIRVIVPQLAMSAGTMIALASKSIVMGKHSNLGPVDPQFNGTPAHGIVEEFETAKADIQKDPSTIEVWRPILSKYPPAFVGECRKAIDWANSMVTGWLVRGMFSGHEDPQEDAAKVLQELAGHALTLSHQRHISAEKALDLGLKIEMLEDDSDLQELVLTLHHACTQTLAETPACKIIENHKGVGYITSVNARLP